MQSQMPISHYAYTADCPKLEYFEIFKKSYNKETTSFAHFLLQLASGAIFGDKPFLLRPVTTQTLLDVCSARTSKAQAYYVFGEVFFLNTKWRHQVVSLGN